MNKYKFNHDFLLKLFLGLILGILFLNGVFSYFVDSEIWSITSSQELFNSFQDVESVYSKPLFYLILKAIYLFDLDSYQHLMIAKIIFSANFVMMNLLIFSILRKIYASNSFAFFSVLILLAYPTWISEGFRVRADFLALTMSLLALNLFCEGRFRENFWKLGGLIVGSLMFTPKAIFWNLPLISFFYFSDENSALFKFHLKKRFVLFVIVFVAILAIFAFPQSQAGFVIAIQYFLTRMGVLIHFSKIGFLIDSMFVLNSFYADRILWALTFALMLMSAGLFLWRRQYAVVFAPALCLVFFLLSTPKTAFFWSVQIVVILFCILPIIYRIYSRTPKILKVLAVMGLSFHIGNWVLVLTDKQSGRDQFEFIQKFDVALGEEKFRLFDSMGMLPRRNYLLKYADFTNPETISFIDKSFLEQRPEIVFNTARISSAFPQLKEKYLDVDYIDLGHDIFILKTVQNVPDLSWIRGDPLQFFNQRVLWHP